jgi:hypothetical protein
VRKSDAAEKLRQLARMQGNLYRVSTGHLQVGEEDLLHYATDVQHNERDIDIFAEQLFAEAPVWFDPRKTKLDERMADIVWDDQITLPIIHIKDKLFLIGPNRLNCEMRTEKAMVHVGGGFQSLEEYLDRNQFLLKRKLVQYMVTNRESLEWVLVQLYENKKLG